MKKKKSSKLKNFIVFLFLVAAGVLLYKFVLEGQGDVFNIDSSASFGMPDRSEKRELDNEGHTEEFWTNNKFKW